MRRATRYLLAALIPAFAAAAALAGATPMAVAAFPGHNGRIVYSHTQSGEIWVMNADGSGQTRLIKNYFNVAGVLGPNPAFSADGRRITFPGTRGSNTDIYIMNADGGDQTRLTTDPAEDYEPAFSPDARKIAFTSNRNGNTDVYLMNADGSHLERLTTNSGADTQPAFSPDGARLAFTSARNGNTDVYALEDDGTVRRLTIDPGIDMDPTFSPDGKRIAFTRVGSGIYTIDADGATLPLRLNDDHYAGQPAFSPDGKRIAFTTYVDTGANGYDVYVMNADGSGQAPLAANPGSEGSPDWGVDNDPPETTITSHPSDPTSDTTPTFAFTAGEPGSTFECRLDANPFAACASPYTTPTLAFGAHTFEVRATDPAGNTDPTPASFAFTVATTSPAPPIPPVPTPPTPAPPHPPTPPPAPPQGHSPRCLGHAATIVGTAKRDRLRGTRGRDVIAGLGGPDTIHGLGGNDLVCGGPGRDRLLGGPGKDRLAGGPGRDRLAGGRGADLLRGGPGADRLLGGPGKDRLKGGPGHDRTRQ